MISLRTVFILALLLALLSTDATAQTQANLFFTSSIDQPNDGQLTVRVFAQADQEDFQLGSASFVFDFSTAGLSFPAGTSAQAGTDYVFATPFTSAPFNSLVTQPTTGKIQIEVTESYTSAGACQGVAVTTLATIEIAEVIFTIEDPTQSTGLLWDPRLTQVFDDGSLASPAAPTTCDNASNVQATEITLGTILGDDTFLPVELTSFEGLANGTEVLLEWSTASETNNAGFAVEQRTDATSSAKPEAADTEQWVQIGWIEGAGTTETAQTYTYRLADLEPGPYLFRLKQIDYDGSFEYSPEVEVRLELAETFTLSTAYPNPFNPETSFRLAVAQAQTVTVAVYDVLGRRVDVLFEGAMQANTSRTFRWQAGDHPSGLYFIRVAGERFTSTRRVTLLK